MMTRYDGSDAGTTDLILNSAPVFGGTDMGVLNTLLEWNRQFPPSEYEKNRNEKIYSGVTIGNVTYAQMNRNPFIDFPQFADAIFLNATTNSFSKWQLKNFTISQLLDSAVSGSAANPDGDALTNYEEFLFNGNPLSGGDKALTLETTAQPNQLKLTFHRPKGISQKANILTKTDLNSATWSAVSNWEATATITDLVDYERVEYIASINPAIDAKRFWIIAFE
jgi:hypothetical protein